VEFADRSDEKARRSSPVLHRLLPRQRGHDARRLSLAAINRYKLQGAKYLTTLDLKSGYWQVPLALDSRPLTAFIMSGKGLFQFTVMPFGLHSASTTFQRLLDEVLGLELEPHVFVLG